MIIPAKALSILVAVYVLLNPAIDAQPSNPQAARQPFLSSLLNVDPIPPRENIRRTAILNTLIEKFKYQSYLEIGQGRKQANFDWIQCKTKIGVDPNKSLEAAYPLTSDEFFALNKNTFDLIFIDGLHHADQVERDILNALKVLNKKGTIVVHDCNPMTEEMQIVPRQQEAWTGDVWKTWVKLRATRPDLNMYVIDVNFGCGIIQKRDRTLEPIRANRQMSYSDFAKNRKKLLNLIDVAEFLKDLKDSASKTELIFSEKSYWQFKGERFIKAEPSPVSTGDTVHVEASGSGKSISAVYVQSSHRSSASFSWATDADLDRLTPGAKVRFTGTLTHSGEFSANAWITLQPYGMEPGLSHPSAQVILAELENISNRTETKTGELIVPEGPLYPNKRMELRFEIYPNGDPSALYRTYEWIASGNSRF